jgi:hypothetical protein
VSGIGEGGRVGVSGLVVGEIIGVMRTSGINVPEGGRLGVSGLGEGGRLGVSGLGEGGRLGTSGLVVRKGGR